MSQLFSSRKFQSKQNLQAARRRAGRAALGSAIESLEQRIVFSTLTVNTVADAMADDAYLSLSEAVALVEHNGDANAALGRSLSTEEQAQINLGDGFGHNDTIQFAGDAAGGSITLGSTLAITKTLAIRGGEDVGVTLTGGASQATHRAFTIASTGDLTLSDLTIRNFSNRGVHASSGVSPTSAKGGAIYVNEGILTIERGTLSNNSAIGGNAYADGYEGDGANGQGGAIYNGGGTVTLTDTTLNNNTATGGIYAVDAGDGNGQGGAIYNDEDGTLTITNGSLTSNTVSRGEAMGGAIANVGGTLTLSMLGGSIASNYAYAGVYSSNDSASSRGGAIASDGGTLSLTFDGVTFTGNWAEPGWGGSGGSAYGGVVWADGGTITVRNSLAQSNYAMGGIIHHGGGTLNGGAFDVHNVNLTVVNSTFYNNMIDSFMGGATGKGSAINVTNGTTSIDFSTFLDNWNYSSGASVSVDGTAGTTLSITNSILAQSHVYYTDLAVGADVTATGSNNLITSTAATGIGVISTANPKLNALADNGGPTKTLKPKADSPVINAAGTTNLTTDARGQSRVNNDVADLGAVETGYASPAFTSNTGATFAPGVATSFTVTTTGDPVAALTYTGTLPTGVTFVDNGDGTATISGTADLSSTTSYPLTITANNGLGSPATQNFTISVSGEPVIDTDAKGWFFTDQEAQHDIVVAASPTAVITYTGTLPDGVTFTDNGDGTAFFTGTAAAGTGGVYSVTVTATNTEGTDTQTITMTVIERAAYTGATSATFTVGSAGTFPLTATGYPQVEFYLDDDTVLPEGLTFVDNEDGTATLSGTPAEGTDGPHEIKIVLANGKWDQVEQTLTLTINPPAKAAVAIGSGRDGLVEVRNADGTTRFTITEPLARRNAQFNVAQADLTGDGTADIIVSPGRNGGSEVAVFDGETGTKVGSFLAYKAGYKHGLSITSADVDGDGTLDIITAQGAGARSRVKVFSGADHSVLAYFRAFDSDAGSRVAAGDLDGDGKAEVIATRAGGGRTVVRVFDGQDLAHGIVTRTAQFTPEARGTNAFVAAGDTDNDGHLELIVSQTAGNTATVSILDGTTHALKTSFQTDSSRHGLRLAAKDTNRDGHADIFAGNVVDDLFVVNVFSGADHTVLDTYQTAFNGQANMG